jgi:hypothetical protein
MGTTKKKAEEQELRASILEYFAKIPDPRVERTKLHSLASILVLSLCAVVCGADDFVGMEKFGRAKEAWLRTLLHLHNGIPSHDTIGRVFAALREFERDVLRERTRAALAATHPGCYDSTHRRSGAARWAEGEWVLDRLGSGRGQDEVGRSQDA